jgi:hypothetical protein
MSMGEWTRLREPSRCLSDLALDQLAAGETATALVTEAREAHLRQCAACEARRADLEAQRAAVLARWPRLTAVEAIAPRRPPLRLAWLTGGLALATVAGLFATQALSPTARSRTKGGFALEVFVKHADGRVEALLPDAAVTEGDALRFRVSADGAGGVVTLLGIDAGGAIASYDPTPQAPPELVPGERRLLSGSIVLDGSVGPERVLALLCPDRKQAASAVDGLRHAARDGAPPVPPGCRQATFPFRKVVRP